MRTALHAVSASEKQDQLSQELSSFIVVSSSIQGVATILKEIIKHITQSL